MGSICWDSISLLFFYWNCGIVFYPCNIGCPNISCYCSAGSKGKKTDSPMKILLGGICFIGLAILAVVAILASGFVLRENYQHKAFYSVPAIQLKKYSAINEWIDECKTIGPDIYGQCIELPSDKTICLYIVYRHQVTDASDASLVSDPLHMRFIAKYRGGTEYDGVDLYFLQGRSSYQMLFSH